MPASMSQPSWTLGCVSMTQCSTCSVWSRLEAATALHLRPLSDIAEGEHPPGSNVPLLPICNGVIGQSETCRGSRANLVLGVGIALLALARYAWLDAPRASEEAKRFGYVHRPPWVYRVGAVGLAVGGLLFVGLAVFIR